MSRITVLISGSGSNLQSLINAQADGLLGDAKIVSVVSSSKKAYGLTRATNACIPTKIQSLYPYTRDIPKEDKEARANARTVYEKDLADAILPVSYTHLDVYKRQIRDMEFLEIDARLIFRIHSILNQKIKSRKI